MYSHAAALATERAEREKMLEAEREMLTDAVGEEISKMLDHDRQEAKSDLEISVRALRIEIAALDTTLTELRSPGC